MKRIFLLAFVMAFACAAQSQSGFVTVRNHQFIWNNQPYYYIGTNYWYGSLLPLEKDPKKGINRLRKELDDLKALGITNLRVMAGAEGSGIIQGVERVGPAFQPEKGKFNESILKGLDVLLYEMKKRNMTAIVFFSNNWEWSGGFLQYLRWNNVISEETFRKKLDWDELRDVVSKFYSCTPCMEDYHQHMNKVLEHTNHLTGKKYTDDPVIMAWELANEPRPMRPAANTGYEAWIKNVAAAIRKKAPRQLVTLGHEGEIGTNDFELYERIHQDKNVDYLTIHIWPKNWGWFQHTDSVQQVQDAYKKSAEYVQKHVQLARKMKKPLVIEEFGWSRDGMVFSHKASTQSRDDYFRQIFSEWYQHRSTGDVIAGANFWAYGGDARPIPGQDFKKKGDEWMGDPPMEQQGLYSVFSSDSSTLKIIRNYAKSTDKKSPLPSDPLATHETRILYRNLHALKQKGIMFGHQDDLAYGVGWKYVPGKSDVKEITGDYPAVYGWELGNIEHGLPVNIDSVPFDKMRQYIREAQERGGVITLSWHADNPLNGRSAWDTTQGSVASILPGGNKHGLYVQWLNKVGDFLLQLKDKKGAYIPVLFRPYHELTGNWFWWCRNTCSPESFKALWRFTVNYLREKRNIHHALYVYNTADFNSAESFLERYPGDDMADMVSFDCYQYGNPASDNRFQQQLQQQLTLLHSIASEKGKLSSLAETGFEAIPYPTWWTEILWKNISGYPLSYVLLWRNHGLQKGGNMHYYVPVKNDASTSDFIRFFQLEKTLFEKDVSKERLYEAR